MRVFLSFAVCTILLFHAVAAQEIHKINRLKAAIRENCLVKVKRYIACANKCPETLVDDSGTPLYYAIENGSLPIIEHIIKHTVFGTFNWINQKPNLQGDISFLVETPLIMAVNENRNDRMSIIKLLLEYGADPNIMREGTALWHLAYDQQDSIIRQAENVEIAKLLIIAGTNLSLRCTNKHNDQYCNNEGCTALTRAKKSDLIDLVQLLEYQQPIARLDHLVKNEVSDYQHMLYNQILVFEEAETSSCMLPNVRSAIKFFVGRLQGISEAQAEDDVLKYMLRISCWDRFIVFLNNNFFCSLATTRVLRHKITCISDDDEEHELILPKKLTKSLRQNYQGANLCDFLKYEQWSDVVVVFLQTDE